MHFTMPSLITSSMVLKFSSCALCFLVSTYAALRSFLTASLKASTSSIFMFFSTTRTCAMNSSAFLTCSRSFFPPSWRTFCLVNVL